jgi:hypothetical protein
MRCLQWSYVPFEMQSSALYYCQNNRTGELLSIDINGITGNHYEVFHGSFISFEVLSSATCYSRRTVAIGVVLTST